MGKCSDSVRFNMWIKKRLYEQLKTVSSDEGRTISDILRVLVIEYLGNKDVESKKKIRS